MKDFLEKNSKVVLIVIFIIGIIVYGFIASKMTSPAYLNVDEELYISMARTFFFDGNIAKNYQVLNYNCIIYSIIISIAYFFGNSRKYLIHNEDGRGNPYDIISFSNILIIKRNTKGQVEGFDCFNSQSFDTRIYIIILSYTRSTMLSSIFVDLLLSLFEIYKREKYLDRYRDDSIISTYIFR